MYTATIDGTGQTITAKTLKQLHRTLAGMLSVAGPRGLTATTTDGAIVHAELYDGQDYIQTADGRTIYRNR